IIYPILIFFLSILVGILNSIIFPFYVTFNTDYHLCGGYEDMLETAAHGIKAWKEAQDDYDNWLYNVRTYHPRTVEINLCKIFTSIMYSCIGFYILGISIGIVSIVKFIPLTIRCAYYPVMELIRYVRDEKWNCIKITSLFIGLSPLILLYYLLIPFIVAIALFCITIAGFAVGLATGYYSYHADFGFGFVNAIKFICYIIYEYDEWTNTMSFGEDALSCLPCFEFFDVVNEPEKSWRIKTFSTE